LIYTNLHPQTDQSRELLYGSVDRVVPSREVVKWINQIMKKTWHKNDPVEDMIAQISRKTGDRTRDIEPVDRTRIIKWLQARKVKTSVINMIIEKTDIAFKEKNRQFGEKLPKGLILKQ
jgi:hypothetical protein